MRVQKKELKERAFIPYQIVITIESEREHTDLRGEVDHVYSHIRSVMGLRSRMGTIRDMFNQILSHSK